MREYCELTPVNHWMKSVPLCRFSSACFLLFAVFVLVLAVGGCVRKKDGVTEILYSFWGSTQQMEVERKVIEAFEAANLDIRVRPLPIGLRYAEKIQAMMIGNVAPDVIMVEMTFYDEWASRGMLADMTGIAERLAEQDSLLFVPERAFSRDGKFYAIPVNAHGNVLYVNLDALEKAGVEIPETGWTWDDIFALGPRFSRRSGNSDAPTDFLMQPPDARILFMAHGAKLFDNPYHPKIVTADSPEAIAAFRMMRDFLQSGYVAPPEVTGEEGTYQLFRDGRVAFYLSGRWMLPEFAGRTSFDWDVFTIPAGPAGAVTTHGGSGLSIWSGSRNKEAARRFVEFYTSPEGVRITTRGRRDVPVSRNAAFGEEFLSLQPPQSAVRYSETMLPGAAQIFLYAPGQAQVMRIFNNRVSQLQNMPDVPVETVVAGLAYDLRKWLEKRERMQSAD